MWSKLMRPIDNFLNGITMYRLLVYYLCGLLVAAFIISVISGTLPYSGLAIVLSTAFITMVCLITNAIFARAFNATPNVESAYITALILALIITPISGNWMLMFWASVWAMASKYIFALNKKHFFNPVAIAVVITAIAISGSASWWIGTTVMLPLVIIGGLLVVKKIHRTEMVYAFFVAASAMVAYSALSSGQPLTTAYYRFLTISPIFFFAFVMLTEPLTTPPTRGLQVAYGAITGFLFAPQVHLGSLYTTPELALVGGNIFSYLVSPKHKLVLVLQQIEKIGTNTYDYVFRPNHQLAFQPGQYLEWTIPLERSDNRGNRRYFTISSAPSEKEIRMGVKFYPEPSRFKQQLSTMKRGDKLIAGSLAGSFTLPKDKNKKLVLIAGGIGITPFRSMIKSISDKNEKRDIVLMYSNNTVDEISYAPVFNEAAKNGVKTVYTLSDKTKIPANWTGQTGFIDEQMIKTEVPDYLERTFYISGPQGMVLNFKELLKNMGISGKQIKTDYFPGFA